MRAIIMAGGKGERLKSVTHGRPKPLVDIGGCSILECILMQLAAQGFRDVVLCLTTPVLPIRDCIGDGARLGLSVTYSVTDARLGTAGQLAMLLPSSGPSLVMNADILTDLDYGELVSSHRRWDGAATVVVHPFRYTMPFGQILYDTSDILRELREKPTLVFDVASGIYVLNPEALALVPERFFDMPDLLNLLLDESKPVRVRRFDGLWHDVGTPDALHRAREMFQTAPERFLPRRVGTTPLPEAAR